MGWYITLAVIFLLAILPLGASVIYDASGVLVRVIAGPLKLKVFPLKKKTGEKKEKVKKEKPKELVTTPKKQKTKEKTGGSITDFLPLVQIGLDFLGDFRRKLRVNRLEMKLIMAGGDPADLAINYGKAWTAMGNLLPLLDRFLVIKKRDLDVECDFVASATTIYARLDITITLGRLISLAVCYGVRTIITFVKISNIRKGGAVK